jgi:hypothetical protein
MRAAELQLQSSGISLRSTFECPAVTLVFCFRSDRRKGVDPDALRGGSPTLRRYHQRLWSKALPSGALFDLDTQTPGEYLHHQSDLGEFFLSSDSLIHTYDYGYGDQVKPITDLYSPAERETFERTTYTIGGMLIFPSNRVDGRQTWRKTAAEFLAAT